MLENLSDDVLGNAAPASERAARSEVGILPVIFCIAGRNELDEAAASLLAHLLRFESRVHVEEELSADALASDNSYRTPLNDATLVCLSLISTGSLARAHYLVRRVRRRAPRAKVLVGFWGTPPGEIAADEATIATSADVARRHGEYRCHSNRRKHGHPALLAAEARRHLGRSCRSERPRRRSRMTAGRTCQRPTRNTSVKLAASVPIMAEAVISVRTT
jgi:hypothetical protein